MNTYFVHILILNFDINIIWLNVTLANRKLAPFQFKNHVSMRKCEVAKEKCAFPKIKP